MNLKDTETYTFKYTTDTKSFKIRKVIKYILIILIMAILFIYTFILINKHYGTNMQEYMSLKGYNAIKKENNEVIEKCNYILNNLDNSKFNLSNKLDLNKIFSIKNDFDDNLTEKEFLYYQISYLKEYSLYKNKIIDDVQNRSKNGKEASFDITFLDKYDYNSFLEKYDNYKIDLEKNNFYYSYRLLHFNSNRIYNYLSIYDDNLKSNKIIQRRIRKEASYIFKEKEKYEEYNYSFMNLKLIHQADSYYTTWDKNYELQNTILLLLSANNDLLDDIIKVGDIHE